MNHEEFDTFYWLFKKKYLFLSPKSDNLILFLQTNQKKNESTNKNDKKTMGDHGCLCHVPFDGMQASSDIWL